MIAEVFSTVIWYIVGWGSEFVPYDWGHSKYRFNSKYFWPAKFFHQGRTLNTPRISEKFFQENLMVVVAVVKAARLTWAGNVCWFFDVAKERKLEEPQRALERNLCQLLPWGLFLFLPALTIFHKKCKRGLPSRLKARRQRIIAHVVREMKIQVVHRFSEKFE